MLSRNEREEYAQAYYTQAQVDRDFAWEVYERLVKNAAPRRNEFLCCIVVHCQQAIEKATKGFLLQRGATFQLTHQIIDWIFHTPGYANYRRLLRWKIQPEVLSAALAVEKLAPTTDTSKKNTEYPYIYEKDGETKIGIPAREFKEPEVMIALRTARIVVGAILRIPHYN